MTVTFPQVSGMQTTRFGRERAPQTQMSPELEKSSQNYHDKIESEVSDGALLARK
jgi:hypothetical protein